MSVIFGIIGFVVIAIVMILFFNKMMTSYRLDPKIYENGTTNYNTCQKNSMKIDIKPDLKLDTTKVNKYIESEKCNPLHTISSKKQISGYAQTALDHFNSIYDKEIFLIPTVYALDPTIAASNEEPQSYLFLGTTEDRKDMLGLIYFPNIDGTYKMMELWDKSDATSFDKVNKVLDELLKIYKAES